MSSSNLAAALNRAIGEAREVYTREWSREINLPLDYIQKQYTTRPASSGKLEAELFGRRREVQIRQFNSRQEFGPDGKKAGVSVQVKPAGARKTIAKAFTLPLRRGSIAGGNGAGVFVRIGGKGGRLKLLYGPAPYQAFDRLTPRAIEAGEDALLSTVGAEMSRIVFEVK